MDATFTTLRKFFLRVRSLTHCLERLYVEIRSFLKNRASFGGRCLEIYIARSKRDGTHAETRFGLSAKRTSPFKSAGVSVQSTTGSRGVQISGQQLYRPCSDVQCKTTGYTLHSHLSPSLPLPCVTMCHQLLNALYHTRTYGFIKEVVLLALLLKELCVSLV